MTDKMDNTDRVYLHHRGTVCGQCRSCPRPRLIPCHLILVQLCTHCPSVGSSKHTTLVSTSGPSYMVLLQLGNHSPWLLPWLTPGHSGFRSDVTFSERPSFPTTTHSEENLVPVTVTLPRFTFFRALYTFSHESCSLMCYFIICFHTEL